MQPMNASMISMFEAPNNLWTVGVVKQPPLEVAKQEAGSKANSGAMENACELQEQTLVDSHSRADPSLSDKVNLIKALATQLEDIEEDDEEETANGFLESEALLATRGALRMADDISLNLGNGFGAHLQVANGSVDDNTPIVCSALLIAVVAFVVLCSDSQPQSEQSSVSSLLFFTAAIVISFEFAFWRMLSSVDFLTLFPVI